MSSLNRWVALLAAPRRDVRLVDGSSSQSRVVSAVGDDGGGPMCSPEVDSERDTWVPLDLIGEIEARWLNDIFFETNGQVFPLNEAIL